METGGLTRLGLRGNAWNGHLFECDSVKRSHACSTSHLEFRIKSSRKARTKVGTGEVRIGSILNARERAGMQADYSAKNFPHHVQY